MAELSPDRFSDFYGVVLTHHFGGPLLWSPTHRAWLRRRSRLHSFEWEEESVDGDEVDVGERQTALKLADEFTGSRVCRRCGHSARPESHYIALDVLAQPAVYCVQRPAMEVVGSSGNTGTRKHWGSPHGCSHVKGSVIYDQIPGLDGRMLLGGYVYGEPLMADEALLLDWCHQCANAAHNVEAADPSLPSESMRTGDVRALLQRIEQTL